MIRLFNTYFALRTIILGVSEAILVSLAFIVAMVANLGLLNASIVLTYERGFVKLSPIVCAFLLCMYYFDLYDSMVLSNGREAFIRTIQVMGTLCLIFAVVYYVFPSLHLGVPVFLTGTIILAVSLAGGRKLFQFVNKLDHFSESCLILGDGPLANAVKRELANRPEFGMRAISQMGQEQLRDVFGSRSSLVLGELEGVTQKKPIRRIIIAMDERRGKLPVEDLLRLKSAGVRIQDGRHTYESLTGKIALESLHPSWLLFSRGFQVSRLLLLYKRLLSVTLSVIGLLLASPLMALIALAIWCDSPGPIIFRQKRVGLNGEIFTLYKFRSMVDGTDKDGAYHPARVNDVRVTRVGRWLRAKRLDEVPQLYNIMRGDMYFVGPRPFVPNQEEEYVRAIPFYAQRWSVRPGATGWAQVNRSYCETLEDNADKLAYDLFYIKNISLGLDLLILFKTLKILLLGRGGR